MSRVSIMSQAARATMRVASVLTESRAQAASVANQLRVVEKKIERLGLTKAKLREELDGSTEPLPDYDKVYRTVTDFFGKPHKLWASGDYADRRTGPKLALSSRISCSRNEGFEP